MAAIILLACFIVYTILSDWGLKKIFNIKRKKGIFIKHINKTHKYIERTILTITIIGIIFLSRGVLVHYWIFFQAICLFLVRSVVQWKYERERKEYILNVNGIVSFIIFAMIGMKLSIF